MPSRVGSVDGSVRSTAKVLAAFIGPKVVVRTLDGEPDKPLAIVTTPAPVQPYAPRSPPTLAECRGLAAMGPRRPARGPRRHLLTSFPFGI